MLLEHKIISNNKGSKEAFTEKYKKQDERENFPNKISYLTKRGCKGSHE